MALTNKPKTKKRRGRKRGYSIVGERILAILSAAAGALDTLGDFTYNPYPYIYTSLGHVYGKETINDAVNDLIKKGLVEGDKSEGLRLTPAGAGVGKGLIRARKKEWDGGWRVVIFDIPEAQRKVRDDLRFELKKLGFGLWQRSAWVTPFDIAEELSLYLRKQNLSEVVQVVVGKRVGGSSDREFAAGVWPLKDINERYLSLLADWREELRQERSGKERFRAVAAGHQSYLDILKADPRLPKQLLPNDWAGDEACKLFKKFKSIMTLGKPL